MRWLSPICANLRFQRASYPVLLHSVFVSLSLTLNAIDTTSTRQYAAKGIPSDCSPTGEDDSMISNRGLFAYHRIAWPTRASVTLAFAFVAAGIPVLAQQAQLKTADAVLERYKRALGGVEAIRKVQWMTVHGEAESSARSGKSTFVYYAEPFKSLFKLTRSDGTEISAGFDGKVSWTI